MKNLNNLHMTARPLSAMVGVGWTDDAGDRYHVWLKVANNPETGRSEPVRPYEVKLERQLGHKNEKRTLFKNPAMKPDGTHKQRADEGYFDTRYLDADAATNAALVAEALRQAEVGGLYELALAQHERDEAEREAQQRRDRVAKMRNDLGDRRSRLFEAGQDRPSAVALIDGLMNASDDDLLLFCNL